MDFVSDQGPRCRIAPCTPVRWRYQDRGCGLR